VACTRIYIHKFSIEPVDNFGSSRALYTTVREYLSERGFPVDRETEHKVSFQLATIQGNILPTAPSDYLTLSLNQQDRVDIELVRISSGGDFSKQQLNAVKDTLEKRIFERSGKKIKVTFVETRTDI
jgi:hypothetical protein